MKKTALVIMAAGIGSRFGKGIKQLAPVGPKGEIIMDYSIHDALEAGFNKVVFIIRKDLEDEFRKVIGDRIPRLQKLLMHSRRSMIFREAYKTGRPYKAMGNRTCCTCSKEGPMSRSLLSMQMTITEKKPM